MSSSDWALTSELRGPPFASVEEVGAARLVLIGAVELAAALSRLARVLGWPTWIVDPRARFAVAERFPDAEEVLVQWPPAAFERLGGLAPDCAVAVLAHDPVIDDPALVAALSSPAFFVGAMGSRRTQAARRQRLCEAGLSGGDLARLGGPLGLDLGARTLPETALSALSEIVAARYGRLGGRLRDAGGTIHEAGSQ